MRITLAQWREKKLPTTAMGDKACDGCQSETTKTVTDSSHRRIILCSYHEGFADGFDAAKGEK